MKVSTKNLTSKGCIALRAGRLCRRSFGRYVFQGVRSEFKSGFTIFNVVRCNRINLPAKANVCDVKSLNKYIDKIEFRPAKTMCGSEMNMLLISMKNEKGIKQDILKSISLDVRNQHNISVTRYLLKHSESGKNKVALTCLNETYASNSVITFYIPKVKKSKTNSSNKLSIKNNKLECKLKSLIKNT